MTTCITLGMSKPLAATAVATRIGILPVLKSSKAWVLSTLSRLALTFKWDGMIRHNRTLLHRAMTNLVLPAPSRFEADRREYWWLGIPVIDRHKLKHES